MRRSRELPPSLRNPGPWRDDSGDGHGHNRSVASQWRDRASRAESVEGVILVPARIYGADRDTAGQLVVDTGAGFLGLGHDIAFWLGIDDRASDPNAIEYTKRPVPTSSWDRSSWIRSRPSSHRSRGDSARHRSRRARIIGQRALRGRCVWIDYEESRVIIFRHSREKGPRRSCTCRRSRATRNCTHRSILSEDC